MESYVSDSQRKPRKPGKPKKVGGGAKVMNPHAWQIAERFKSLRERMGMTQAQFADHLRMSRRGYQDIEGRANYPSGPLLRNLAEAREINLYWLLTGEGPERLDQLVGALEAAPEQASQPVRQTNVKIAFQLVSEALGPMKPTLDQHAELVALVLELLEHGLPEARVLYFARQAVTGSAGGEGHGSAAGGGAS